MNEALPILALALLVPKRRPTRSLAVGFAPSREPMRERVDVEALELGEGSGRFVRLELGQSPARVARAILRSEAAALGLEREHVTPEMVAAYVDLVFCGPWNDRGHGTRGAARGEHVGPHGRTIRFVRCNPPNRARLRRGLPPIRNVEQGEPGRKARALDGLWALELPYLWWPPLNLERFKAGEVTTAGLRWHDGSSVLDPPPEVTAHPWLSVLDLQRGDHAA